MYKKRIGNDIRVLALIRQQIGEVLSPFDMRGRNISVGLVNPRGVEMSVPDFEIAGDDGNLLAFNFYGRDQRLVGIYTVVVRENDRETGMRTVDKTASFELVEHSYQEATDNEGVITIDALEIEMELAMGTKGDKGDKGDKMTYADLTDSDKADLYEGGASLIRPLLDGKQDAISDLNAIRQGAEKGSTALQSESDPIYTADKPNLALKSELDGKVDKEEGKGLSSNDYTDSDKAKLTELEYKTEAISTEDFETENDIVVGGSLDDPTLVIGNKSVNFYGSVRKNGSEIVSDEEMKELSHLTNNITEERSETIDSPNISITNDDVTETYARIDESGIKSNNFFINSNGQIVDVKKTLSELNKEIQGVAKIQDIKIQIPDIVYAVEGIELNLWNDAVSLSSDRGLASPLNYYTKWKCNKGKVTPRGFRFTPTASDAGEHNCTCAIYNIQNEEIDSKSFVIKVATKNSLTQPKRILFCGDSLGASTAQAIYNNFHSELFAGIIPTMVGNVGNTAKGLYYGGWKWAMFANKGETMYRLQVSSISSLEVGARYVDNRNGCFEILEVNITSGSGNILMARVYEPQKYDYHELDYASGTLTKAEPIYGGDDSFSYTGNQEAGNPLWNEATNKIDVANYRAKIGLAPNEKIDMVIIQSGINDNGYMDEEANRNDVREYIGTLYREFTSDNPECIFAIGTPPSHCNTDGGMGNNFGATNDAILYGQREYILRNIYLEFDNNKVDYPNLRLLSENLCCDRYYGYTFNEQSISSRYTITEQVHSNMVHPSESGYAQLGDSLYASIINILK